jgi:hypothetical protein
VQSAMKSAQLNANPITAAERRPRADDPRRVYLAIILIVVGLGMATIALSYWPGIMIDDARWQYQQSVDNAYEDWHPPLMAWIWHYTMLLVPGPGPMLLLQLGLYWAGVALIALWLCRRGQPRFGIAAGCVGWLPVPLALMGSVTKDCLMTGALISAVGLLLWSKTVLNRAAGRALGIMALVALLFAAALRVNAFLACVPLALTVLPKRLTCTIPRGAIAALASAAIFFITPSLIATALHAEDTDSQLSLIIFDLGGITEHSGVSQFPDLHVANPVAVNHRCYDPYQWDSYSTWARTPCPLGFAPFQALLDDGDISPRSNWLRSIAAHPLAYAEHRLAHFNQSTWFLVRHDPDPPAWKQSVPNPWNFQVRPNPVLTSVDTIADGTSRTPLGWPVFWIALALAVLIVCRAVGLSDYVTAVAASAFLYGTGYLIFGVATGMRYYGWVITGAAIATVLAAAELSWSPGRIDRRSIVLASATVIVPTVIASLARFAL